MNGSFLIAAAESSNVAAEVAKTFNWSLPAFLAQLISFVIVALALKKWAFGPIQKLLAERRKMIADALTNSEKIKLELARAEASRLEVLNTANAQAVKLIEEARAAAAKVLETESQKAIATANLIIAKAKESNEAELARMKMELRKEVGRLVIATTAKVSGRVLTAEDQQRLAEETNRQLVA
jgi:F-type H+-transporting ATPase subunit b